jgi:hypothetical protein
LPIESFIAYSKYVTVGKITMTKNDRAMTRFLIIAFVIGLFGLIVGPALVQAGPTLPPRDPPTPTPGSERDKGSHKEKPVGAYIALQTSVAGAGAWSVVQWQDSNGNWHDVEGWRGPLSDANNRLWWVAAKDFGTGPFRWAVTQGPGGPLLGVSAPFNLPGAANETVQVVLVKS